MTNTQGKHGNHFSLEPLVHEPAPKGGVHLSTDTKRVALVLILAVASFLTVYFLSGSGDDVKTQLRFADDGSGTPAPTAEATPIPVATAPGSLAYNGFPDLTGNGNTNGIASTVIRNSAASNMNGSSAPNGNMNGTFGMNANANGVVPTSGTVGIPSAQPSYSPLPTSVYPSATPTPAALGQYGVIGSAGEMMAPTATPTMAPSATPTPSSAPSASPTPTTSPTATPMPTPTAEPIKRGMEQSGPAAWMALLPVLMVGIFRFARKSA